MFQGSEDVKAFLKDRYKYLKDIKDPGEFALELREFVHLLYEDNRYKGYTSRLVAQYDKAFQEYEASCQPLIEEARAIRNEMIRLFPESDDSNLVYPRSNAGPDNFAARFSYERSFAYFNDLIQGTHRSIDDSRAVFPKMYEDESKVGRLVKILNCKFDSLNNRLTSDQQIYDRYLDFLRRYRGNFEKHVNARRVSRGKALIRLHALCSQLDCPIMEGLADPADPDDLVWKSWYAIIQAIYNLLDNIGHTNIGEHVDRIKKCLERAYDGIQSSIGTQSHYDQMLMRYKTRSELYDSARLHRLTRGRRGIEDVLARDLATYFFDSGVSTHYRLRAGNHEMDICDPDSKRPLVIETKVYRQADQKKVIDGFHQVHGYLTRLHGKNANIAEGYYVVYRLGGPLYDLPSEVVMNQFRIAIILIDLGKSHESGSMQPKPIMITENQLIEGCNPDNS